MRFVAALRWSTALLIVGACGGGTSSLGGDISGSGIDGGSGGSGGTTNPTSGGSTGGGGTGAGNVGDDAGGSSGVGGTGMTVDGSGIDGAIADDGGRIPPVGDSSTCTGELSFPDINIESAAATVINKLPPILAEDAALVTKLDVIFTESRPLISLRGLECFPALQEFSAVGPELRSLGRLDLSPLATLPALVRVTIWPDHDIDYGAPFANLDLSPLGRVPTITLLALGTNAVTDIAPLALLPNVNTLFLHSDALTDLSPIAGAKKLGRVIVSGMLIRDISPLADALQASNTELEVNIGPTSVSDFSPLSKARNLANLSIAASPITDMAPLASLPNLANLSIVDGAVDRVVLGPSVTTLDLSSSLITDWSPLASSQVHKLTVRRNGITDLAPFVLVTALDNGGFLDVLENSIDCTTQITHIWALQQRGVTVKQDCQP